MGEQLLIAVIDREVDGATIPQRAADGYVNATALCQASGKKLSHYLENKNTQEFIAALSADAGIPASDLVIVTKGGNPRTQGTWIHPDMAVNLGQWCSPKFAVAVSKWVREWMSGTVNPSALPYHIARYLANRAAIPPTHWSMLNEMTFLLIAPLEQSGYRLPEHMVPDISEGRMFSKWLRDVKGIDTKNLPTYRHVYNDGRVVDARLYPNEILHDFRNHFHGVWMQQRAIGYFTERDEMSAPHLPILIEYSQQVLLNG